MTKLIDYAFVHPSTDVIDSVDGVLRYGGGGSESKLLSAAETTELHDKGKVIGLVFETQADRALDGKAAGIADREQMETWCNERGYPRDCPIFYAVDFEASYSQVADYFDGVMEGRTFQASGPYGSYDVVEGFAAAHPEGVSWQTIGWSAGKRSKHATFYQNGVVEGRSYNGDAVLKPAMLWGPSGATQVPPPKPKKPTNFNAAHAAMLTVLTTALNKRAKANAHPLAPRALERLDAFDTAEAAARKVSS